MTFKFKKKKKRMEKDKYVCKNVGNVGTSIYIYKWMCEILVREKWIFFSWMDKMSFGSRKWFIERFGIGNVRIFFLNEREFDGV